MKRGLAPSVGIQLNAGLLVAPKGFLSSINGLYRQLWSNGRSDAASSSSRNRPPALQRGAQRGPAMGRRSLVVRAEPEGQDEGYFEVGLGPSSMATMQSLDWRSLCEQVASFASTTLGKKRVRGLLPATSQLLSETLQAETAAAALIEGEFMLTLDFGGIMTEVADEALQRANRGGFLNGPQLKAVSGLVSGSQNLLRQLSTVMRSVREAEGSDGRSASALSVLDASDRITIRSEIASRIDSIVDDEGIVRDSASDELRAARTRCRTLESRIKNLIKSTSGGIVDVGGRICVSTSATSFDQSSSRDVVVSSGTGMIVYEPASVVPLNNELQRERQAAAAAEEKVLWDLTESVLGYYDDLYAALEWVIDLDCILARSRFSRWIDGVRPTFVPFPALSEKTARTRSADDLFITLRRLRHPLLMSTYLKAREATERTKMRAGSPSPGRNSPDSDEPQAAARPPIPIDVTVEKGIRCVLITGPNTGGKTAALKALGLAVLMSKAGLFIPCSSSSEVRLPWFSAVLADIGDEQSLSASLSTFSGHLSRIQKLRSESDSKSLVLLDEIGTGTDPVEGSALGIALLKRLVKGGPGGAGLVFGTTHMGSLIALKYESPMFENASVEFDEEKLEPTYRLLWGIPGRSNALNIAEKLGLKKTEGGLYASARARGILGEDVADVQQAVLELENLRREVEHYGLLAEQAAAEILKKSKEARSIKRAVLDETFIVEKRERDVMTGAIQELQREVKRALALEGPGAGAAGDASTCEGAAAGGQAKAKTAVAAKPGANNKQSSDPDSAAGGAEPDISSMIDAGRKVRVRSLNADGSVLSRKGSKAIVQVGMMRTEVSIEDLQLR